MLTVGLGAAAGVDHRHQGARRRALRCPGPARCLTLERCACRRPLASRGLPVSSRTTAALSRRANWIQLAKFGVVGVSGYAINLVVYAALLGSGRTARLRSRSSSPPQATTGGTATGRSRGRRATSARRACASSSSRCVAFGVNQLWLAVFLDWLDWGKIVSQAVAIVLVTPLNFLGNKLWSLPAVRLAARRSRSRSRSCRRRAPATTTATTTTATVTIPAAAAPAPTPTPRTTRAAGDRSASSPYPKVADWLEALPAEPDDRRDVRAGRLDGQRLVGQRRRDRDRQGRRRDRRGHRGVDRARRSRGGWRAATRARSAATKINSYPGLARRSARSSCSGWSTGGGCSRCATSTCSCCSRSRCRSGSSTTGTSSRRCRSPIRRSSGCSLRCVWIARARPAVARRAGVAGLGARRRDGVPRRASASA